MSEWILTLVTFLPLIGALFLLLINGEQEVVDRNAKYVALWTTLSTFILSLYLLLFFDSTTADFQFEVEREWLGGGINYHMGVDGISVLFVMLTTFLTPLCILASWDSITNG